MKKILLVDDEPAARQHIRDSFPWNTYDCEIVGEAGHGEEALVQCALLQPDIALIDITMPVMDGLELLHRLDAEFPHIRSIMLTAHRDFAYAQQAMLSGACGYVLKAPISMVEMKKALDRACIDLDRDHHYKRHEKSHERLLRNYQYPLRRKFFSDILNGLLTEEREMILEGARLDIHLVGIEHGLLLCAADKLQEYAQRYPERDHSLIEYSMLEIVRETLIDSERYPFELFPLEFGRFALLLGCDGTESEPYASRLNRVCRGIAAPLGKYLQMNLTAAYSRPVRSLSQLRRTFTQTEKSMVLRFYQDHPAPIDAGGPLLFQPVPVDRWAECVGRLAGKLKAQEQELQAGIDEWIRDARTLLLRFQPDPSQVSVLLSEIRPHLDERLPNVEGDGASWPDVRSFVSLNEILAALHGFMQERARLQTTIRELRPEISNAVLFIRQNLQTELTLESIASKVQLSPSYFGHLFKKEMGVSLIEYIVEQRIELAKTWLKDGRYRNYELAEKTGFQNYSYFCTTFKKVTGMTPNEYKNAHKRKTVI